MKMTEKEYAQLANRVYDRKDIRNKMTLPEGVTELEWQDDAKWTGFSAGVYQVAENHIVISFTGSNEELIEDFLLNNIPIGLGYSGPQVEDAARLTFKVMEKYPNAKIEFTGHSLGGGLASMMAILFNKKAYVFDPAPFKSTIMSYKEIFQLFTALYASGYRNKEFFDYFSYGFKHLLKEDPLLDIYNERVNNVSSWFTSGEFLQVLRDNSNYIESDLENWREYAETNLFLPETRRNFGAIVGQERMLDIGKKFPEKMGIFKIIDWKTGKFTSEGGNTPSFNEATQLHSILLLQGVMASDPFRESVKALPIALNLIFDSQFYAVDLEKGTDPDLLARLVKQQIGGVDKQPLDTESRTIEKRPVLDSLADALNTVAARTGAADKEEQQMLAAQALEWFYFQTKDYQYNGSAFFKNTANGVLQYTLAASENYDGQQKANTNTKGQTVVRNEKSGKYTEAWIKQIFAANGLSGQAVRWRGWQQWTLATNATASSAWALDADKSQIMVGAEGNDAFSGGNGDDLLIGGAGNDTLSGKGGHNVLAGGAGEDTYFITAGSSNTIIDADGAGSILWNGMRLTGESKADGENRWVDAGRNITYYMLDNDLYISHFSPTSAFGIRIAGWKEGALGLHLGSEPAERSHYTRILGDWQPRLTDAGTYAPLGERLADGSLKGGVHKENGFDDVIAAPKANTPYHIEGGKGDDALGGNTGNDLIEGGEGRDLIAGGGGSDILAGGGGDDFIFAAARLNASPRRSPDERWTLPPRQRGRIAFAGRTWGQVEEKGGDNPAYTMYGIGRPFNEPQGTAGDRIYGGDGNDSIYAGNTDDYIAADSEYMEKGQAISGTGNDSVYAGGGNDTVLGGGGKDLIWGDGLVEAGNINSVAPEMHGHDTIDAGEGDDRVYGGGGDDFIQGGSGNDRLFGDSAFVQPEEILPVKFHGTDEIHGGSGSDWIVGGGGDDFLYGDEGDDFLFGDANDDNPYPELNGRDYIEGGSGDDQASGGYGDDEIHGGEGDDKLFGNAGSDTIFGGEGNDLIRGDGEVGLQNGADDGADTLHGGRGNDNITGDGGNDLLYGDEDDDTVYGGAGNDTLYGGDGDDTLIGDNSDQTPEEDLGIPAESGRDDTLYGGNGDDQLMGGIGNDTLYGGEGNDKLWGDLGLPRDHHPEGFAGDDVLDGGAGDDYLDGGRGNDLLYGGEGSDMLSGGNGNDRLYGGEGSDLLDGGEGDDLLYGGAGGDDLDGGTGQDRLEGGAGNDIYRYHTGDGTTTIADREGQSAILLDSLQDLSFEEYENGIAIRNGKAGDVLYLEGYHTAQSGKASADLENVFLYEQSLNGNWISLADIEEQIRQPAAPAAANTAPQVLHPAEAYTARAGTPFSYTLPENWFADREDAALAYGLAAADGSPLPNWLHYDPATRTLSGTPPEQVSGSLKLTVTATDSGGLSAAQDWMFSVQGKYPAALGSAYNVIRGSQIIPQQSALMYADHFQTWEDDATQEDNTRTILSHQGSDAVKMRRNAEGIWDMKHIRNTNLPENPVLHGTDGADSLKGQSSLLPWGSEIHGHGGNDTLYGSNKADLLFGDDGDDDILGYDGSDTLFGGRGNDQLNGGAGSDTYIFTKGDGQDTVIEHLHPDEYNRTIFADRQLSEMVLRREGNDLAIAAAHGSDCVTFKNFFGMEGYENELFLFQDTAMTGDEMAAALGRADLMVQAMSSFGTDAAAASPEHTRQPETPNMLLAAGSLS